MSQAYKVSTVKEVLTAYQTVLKEVYLDGMSLDDIDDKDLYGMITDELNKKGE